MTAGPDSEPAVSRCELTRLVGGASGLSARAIVMAKRLLSDTMRVLAALGLPARPPTASGVIDNVQVAPAPAR
jgi:hypothetical protein